jgi:hypothetical protein
MARRPVRGHGAGRGHVWKQWFLQRRGRGMRWAAVSPRNGGTKKAWPRLRQQIIVNLRTKQPDDVDALLLIVFLFMPSPLGQLGNGGTKSWRRLVVGVWGGKNPGRKDRVAGRPAGGGAGLSRPRDRRISRSHI